MFVALVAVCVCVRGEVIQIMGPSHSYRQRRVCYLQNIHNVHMNYADALASRMLACAAMYLLEHAHIHKIKAYTRRDLMLYARDLSTKLQLKVCQLQLQCRGAAIRRNIIVHR